MVQLNLALREINCKIVYFGPGLSGKTTNLEVVHERAPDSSKGELTSIATESDRTLFFDFMPLNLGMVGGMKTKFQLYTVPGQVYYNSTRKLVLRGADGVIFVADSAPDKMAENIESLDNLEECLREQDKTLADMPHVLQWNKRDLPGAMDAEEMEKALNRYGAPCTEAVANKGEGVVETFKLLSGLVLDKVKSIVEKKDATGKQVRPVAPAGQKRPATEVRPSGGRPASPRTGQTARRALASEFVPERLSDAPPSGGTVSPDADDRRSPEPGPEPSYTDAARARTPAAAVPVAQRVRSSVQPSVRVPAPPRRGKAVSTHRQRMLASSGSGVRGRKRTLGRILIAAAAFAAVAVVFALWKGIL